MENNDLNKICFDFQNNIIEYFNEANLPFLLKYYLFRDIWDGVNNKKIANDRILYSSLNKEEQVKASVEIPQDFFKENNKEQEQKKEN